MLLGVQIAVCGRNWRIEYVHRWDEIVMFKQKESTPKGIHTALL